MAEYKRANHELVVSDNPPSANQLLRLASRAMASANKTNTLRTGTLNPHAHMGVQYIQYLNEAAELVENGYPTRMERRLAMRIGKQVLQDNPLQEWSLRVFDTHWFEQPNGSWTGMRDVYRFGWNRLTTTLAERTTKIVPAKSETPLDTQLDRLKIPDDMAEMFHVEQEMAQVTADDCELLIEDTALFYAQDSMFINRR